MYRGEPDDKCRKRDYTKKEAQTMKNLRESQHNGHRLRVYQCNRCPHWHLTHRGTNRDVLSR